MSKVFASFDHEYNLPCTIAIRFAMHTINCLFFLRRSYIHRPCAPHPPARKPTHPHAHPPARSPTRPLTHPPAHSLTRKPALRPAHQVNHPPPSRLSWSNCICTRSTTVRLYRSFVCVQQRLRRRWRRDGLLSFTSRCGGGRMTLDRDVHHWPLASITRPMRRCGRVVRSQRTVGL